MCIEKQVSVASWEKKKVKQTQATRQTCDPFNRVVFEIRHQSLDL